jgi:hypothetical protein
MDSSSRKADGSSELHSAFTIESLENRMLFHGGFGFGGGGGHEGGGFGDGGFGQNLNTIEFSQAPTAVQTGLEHLATTDGLTPPTSTSTQTVFLGNRNGVETFTIDLTGTGTQSALTVDQNGNPVTAPTNGTTTYGTLPVAVTTEASAIATALSLSVPASTANVQVSTPAGGTSVYTIHLTSSSSSTSTSAFARFGGRTVTIDANGNPVGNQSLPFSVIPAAIQTALNNNRPSGATALAATSTQNVSIRTNSGVLTYSTTFTTTGTSTTVTVNASGALASLPSHSTTTFSALSTVVQNAINALAADNGVTGTIAGTTSVRVYNEANGTTIYSINVNGSKTGFGGGTFTYNLTISVDENGNPTTLPANSGNEFGSSFAGFGGNSFFNGGGFFGRRRH